MGPAGRQLGALLWKNWLCRRRHRVLFLAEFIWPCTLFMILTVLRFQEPPRHRDNCYLQPRDLPSAGVFPFVRGLLCNTGARCRNTSYAESPGPGFRAHSGALSLSRFQARAVHHTINDLVFLQEMQDLADEICELMDKATDLKKVWVERAKTPGSSPGSGFPTLDLNKTEAVISKLESLQQQPQVWDFLRSLPRLSADDARAEDGARSGVLLLRVALSSLASLEDLDWLQLNPTFSRASGAVLHTTLSALTLLQGHGAATGPGYRLSLRSVVWDPPKVQADLKSRFGLDDLHAERVLNYSAELKGIPTDSSLEQMVCSVLSQTSEDEADREGHPGDGHARWSAASTYLVHAVSWPRVCRQVLQQVLTRAGHRLEALGGPPEGESLLPRWAVETLRAGQLLLEGIAGIGGIAAAAGPGGRAPPDTASPPAKEQQLMEQKLRPLEDERRGFLVSSEDLGEPLLLPNPSASSGGPTETLPHTRHSRVNRVKRTATQKVSEFGQEMIEEIPSLEKKGLHSVLRFLETALSGSDPKPLARWTRGVPDGGRGDPETSAARSDVSVAAHEGTLSKSFNLSQLFRSDGPTSPAGNLDFVHLSGTVIHSLRELGFLRQEQVSEALDIVRAVRNASGLLSALSEPQRRDVEDILTHMHLDIFQDRESALLLQICSLFHQYVDQFLGFQRGESPLSLLTRTSEHILELRKQFSFQNLSRAFAFLYETTELLGGISEAAPCQQLLSIFSLLELQTQSLMSTGVPELEVVNATLTGLRQRLLVDGDGRTSLFQYVHQLLRSSAGALLDNGCFALGNESASVNHSGAEGPPQTPPWAHVLASLSADGSVPGGLTAVRCSISWLQTWTGIWRSMAQMLKLDVDVLAPLHVGLTQLLGELESDAETSESCQGVFPIHRPARLIIDLLGNITQGGGIHDRDSFLNLRALWGALQDTLVRVKSLRWDQVEKSLSAMDTALGRLQAFLLNTRAGGEFLSSLLGVLASGSASEHRGRHVHLTNLLLSRNLTEGHTGGLTADLRETILFLRNVSRDQDLLSCADTFQNMTELMLEGGSLPANTSRRALRVLATLNSSLFSERAVRGLKVCIEWVGGPSHADATGTHGSAQGRLRGVLRRVREVESGLNSTLKLVTWLLNTMESDCVVHKSNINCVNIYLKNATDFLHVILAAVFEKEKAPTFEILLTHLNDSTDQVRMLISNLTRDFESASQSSWTHFIESSLRPVEMSGEIPGQFHNVWQHVVALGKDIQELAKDIFPALLENNVSSEAEKLLNLFTTGPKEEARHRLDSPLFHLARYLAFNLSHDLQNPRQTSPREILAAVSLGSQVVRDVLSALAPSVQHSNPEDPGSGQVLKKAAALLLALRKTDIDLLGDQLEQVGESLMDFLKNVSRLGTGSRGVHLLVGLMEKLADSFRSWNVNHLLRLSRLFPREDVDAVVGLYYALPHAVRLLHRVVDENVTEALQDIYSFIVLHGTGTSLVTKEDLAAVMKTLLDTVELVSDKPSVLAEAATCLPVVWCRSHTTSGFQQGPELEACNGHFYSQVASILGRLHLSPRGDVSQCSNGSAPMEVTREMVCVVRELVDWGSFLLELSEVFRVNSSLLRAVQGWWRKVLPFIPAPGNQSTGSTPGLCPPGPMKQVALQIIETFKEVNFSKVASDENILETLATLNETLNTEGAEAALRHLPLTMERRIEALSGDRSLENSARSLVSLLVTLLNADRAGGSVDVLSRFVRQGGATHIVEDLWRESEQTVKDPNRGSNSRTPFSDISKEIPAVNPGALHNMTLQLARLLGSQNSSPPQASEMTEGFLSLTKRWLRKYANEKSSKMSQTLFLLMANESSTDKGALLTNITSLLGDLKNISREGHSHGDLLDQEQPTNFSVVQLLLKSFLANAINNLAVDSHEAAWNLSDTDFQIMHFINLTLDQTKSEKGERLLLPPGSRVDFMERLLKTFFTFLEKESSENRVSLLTGLCRDVAAGTRLTQNLEKILLPGNSVVAFLGNFSVTADVKVKDLMRNVTELTGELRSVHISEGTIHSLLEADISHSQVLSSALVAALSESCGRDVLGLLLAFPEGREAQSATEELCRLPGAAVYTLLLSMTRNLDLHSLVYTALMPAEANRVLSPLLDVVSRLSRLLPRASRVLEDLPEFLDALRVTAWLDVPDVEQSKTLLSSSKVFLNLPRINELLGDDREKLNIPEDSTPFCLKLYGEILQSPNGALVWSFLKPILHGKTLHMPNTPEINKVIHKANYTFVFVDKLRTLSETLLNLSSSFQSSGHGRALEQLQEVLRNKFVRHFVESKLYIDIKKLIDKLQTYGECTA
uniref:ATP binding cassette subfamily A member 13 n=1 Tax=Molossus molossus TaxID=27622 RepID=A0A7J8HAD6_MOLMO|nr:ATP binding cassette subfamily A member 13 [Molossus molossus]